MSTEESMLEQLTQTINAVSPAAGSRILLGYSGGVDSEVLASLLAKFAQSHPEFNYLLVYVHHGLSDNADTWAEHCCQSAARYALPFQVCRVKVATGARLSLEAEARKVRYQAISELMQAGDILLTAHHQDDQLETLLLALKRGQGPKGLAAMGKCQKFAADKWQLRPLLDVSRAEIEAYADKHGIKHIEDESNFDTSYDRNFLRHEIIPTIKARWSHFAQTATRSAALCAEQQVALDEILDEKLGGMLEHTRWGTRLSLEKLKLQKSHWQALLLRAFILKLGLPLPSKIQLDQALSQLLDAKVDANVMLKISGLVLRRFESCVYAMLAEPQVTNASADSKQKKLQLLVPQDWQSDNLTAKTLECGDFKLLIKMVSEQASASLRMPKQGEQWQLGTVADFGFTGAYRCHPHNRAKGRELKKCWQEQGVPPWIRQKLPVICVDGKLAVVADIWLEKSFLASTNDTSLTFKLTPKP